MTSCEYAKFEMAHQHFKSWTQAALQFWAERALDPRGGFAEHLNLNGEPDFDYVRRVRVQARQAYVYAHAGALDMYDQARALSDHAWAFLTGPCAQGHDYIKPKAVNAGGRNKGGRLGTAFYVTGTGKINRAMRDSYSLAFTILAGAWRYKAWRDEASLEFALSTLEFMDTYLASEHGGWHECLPPSRDEQAALLPRRQNPHMHMFEALLALYEATGEPRHLARAKEVLVLFERVFFEQESGAVYEFFTQDWQRDAGDGGPIEPGHMMEWCWLLRYYQRLGGDDMSALCERLFDTALRLGQNPNTGLLYDKLDSAVLHQASKPLSEIAQNLSAASRSWPQTELIKASLVQAAYGRDEGERLEMLAQARRGIERLFETYLNVPQSIYGGWYDQFDAKGQPVDGPMSTSTFYHYFCAYAEVERLAHRLSRL